MPHAKLAHDPFDTRLTRVAVLVFVVYMCLGSPAIGLTYDDCYSQSDCLQSEMGLPATEIASYPAPDVRPLTANTDLMYDRWYVRVSGPLEIFDAPGGNLIGFLDGGFNFLTAQRSQDGWIEINPGQWARADNLSDATGIVSGFTGVQLDGAALPYPMAWILVNLYPSQSPGSDLDETQPIVWRYTRVNLYASAVIEGEIWYQIGVNQWVHQFHVATPKTMTRPAEVDTNRWISLDLYEQTLVAYENETPVFATLISSGREIWPTNEGLYHIYFRRQRDDMTGGVVGDDFYFLEEVPWTMFFDAGRALHGAYWHDGFGYRRSHGCVNLSITDAHWLYMWVAEEMGSLSSADVEVGPAVFIYSSGEYR